MTQRSNKKAVLLIVVSAAVGACVVTVALPLMGMYVRQTPQARPPEVLAEVPDFTLTDQHENTVTREDLKGKVWIADFMFTRCNGICPVLVRSMRAVRDATRAKPYYENLQLVSFTVDPAHDTPDVLRDYARTHQADSDNWRFLTAAERAPMWTLIEEGFMLPVAETPDAALPFSHSGKLVLVDAQGRIRGYYSGLRAEERQELLRDLDLMFQ